MISVLIATKNRPEKLNECIKHILKNTFTHYELLIIDQSTNSSAKNVVKSFHDKRIVYLENRDTGKSRALNTGLLHVRGTIIAFTDDDCIVSKQWLVTIEKCFTKLPYISAVFGTVLPYQPHLHTDQVCPSLFRSTKNKTINKPVLHYQSIGFGSNMAIKKEAFNKFGLFKPWLGPGSGGDNAEDADMALRLLCEGEKIYIEPKMIVYHDKWLSKNQIHSQLLSYTCGEVACYGYYMFQGKQFAAPVVQENFKNSYWKFRKILKKVLFLQWNSIESAHVTETFNEFITRMRGLFIALWFSIFDPMTVSEKS